MEKIPPIEKYEAIRKKLKYRLKEATIELNIHPVQIEKLIDELRERYRILVQLKLEKEEILSCVKKNKEERLRIQLNKKLSNL